MKITIVPVKAEIITGKHKISNITVKYKNVDSTCEWVERQYSLWSIKMKIVAVKHEKW